MRLQSGELIAGHPALTMRRLMQRGREYGPTTAGNPMAIIAEVLNIDLAAAKQVYEDLCTEGYIEPVPDHHVFYEKDHWFTTIKGNALANATARKPITRQTADQVIAQLLVRVKQINMGDYAYRVKKIIVFGSYLSDSSLLGDVDISIELEDRYQNVDARKMGHDARIALARASGRRFRDAMEMLLWPEQEVLLILKNRSPSLSLHDEWRERVLERHLPSKILFDAEVSVHAPTMGFLRREKSSTSGAGK